MNEKGKYKHPQASLEATFQCKDFTGTGRGETHSSDSSEVLGRQRLSESCCLSILHILGARFYVRFQLIGCIANLKDLLLFFHFHLLNSVSQQPVFTQAPPHLMTVCVS